MGVTIGTGGRLTLDQTRFREALAEDPASVESLFAARTQSDDTTTDIDGIPGVSVRNTTTSFTTLGIMGQFEELVNRFIDTTSGVLTGRTKGLDDQIALQRRRVEAFTSRLSQRQQVLQRQFLAMETAIGKLQTQQGALQSLAG